MNLAYRPCYEKTFECKFRTHTPKSTNQKAFFIESGAHVDIFVEHEHELSVRENRRGNKEWTIQRHWQHWIHKTLHEDKQTNVLSPFERAGHTVIKEFS